jgi:hypothetical protein
MAIDESVAVFALPLKWAGRDATGSVAVPLHVGEDELPTTLCKEREIGLSSMDDHVGVLVRVLAPRAWRQ